MKGNSKLIIITLILVFISTITAAYWYYQMNLAHSKNNSVLAEIKYWGEIAVGTNPINPPMEFVDDSGTPAGFDIDLANEIADQMGVSAGIEVYPQNDSNDFLFADLRSKKIDMVISSIDPTSQLPSETITSIPYKISDDAREYVIVFRKQDSELRDSVNFAISALQQSGKLDELRKKWFAREP